MIMYNHVMSSDHIRLRYDGPALAGHSIDVDDLAPALLALGDLCKIANNKFNGDRAAVKVLVNADLEQNCFEISIQLVQTLLEQARTLINHDDVSTAKEIFEWLGITYYALGAPIGLFHLLKYLRGRKITSREMIVQDGKDVVQIKVEGDNNHVYIHPQTNELINDYRVIKKVQKVVAPLANEGYEKMEFDYNDDKKEEITKEEAKEILNIDGNKPLELTEDEESQVITAWIRVYSPVYEKDAKNWKFEYGEKHETIDISETDIAENAIERGGALVNDTYKVKLEITQTKTQAGNFKNRYKIKEIVDFHPATLVSQNEMFKDDGP